MAALPSSTVADLWLPVTVRVTWELVQSRVPLTSGLLDDVREHVLRHLPEGISATGAERLATAHAQDFISRARGGQIAGVELPPPPEFEPPESWSRRLSAGLSPDFDTVLQLHYGDGEPLESLEARTGADRGTLEAACAGLRATLRAIADTDAVTLEHWSDEQVDQLVGQIAGRVAPSCPPPDDLALPSSAEHARRCSRCRCAVRLIQGGKLTPHELYPPLDRPPVPEGSVGVLALHLHPDARRYRKRLQRVLGAHLLSAGPDVWLVREEDIARVMEALHVLCEEGTPKRIHLRGAVVEGPARWSEGLLLGPLALEAIDAAQMVAWSDVRGAGELPAALPPAPKARDWWAGAAALAVLNAAVALWLLNPGLPPPTVPVEAEFADLGSGWDVRFDTSDLAVVDVVVLDDRGLRVHRAGLQAAKGAWSTGDGEYQIRLPGRGVALVTSPEGVALDELIIRSKNEAAPLETLAGLVREADNRADVAISPPRTPGAP